MKSSDNLKKALELYGISDRKTLDLTEFIDQTEQALKGGLTCFQLREKKLPNFELVMLASLLKPLCDSYNCPLIINDNIAAAIMCDAGGVHIGQEDGDIKQIRSQLGDDKILGVSAQTVEQAKAAEAAGADYLGVGAVFATTTKEDAANVSLDELQAICDNVSIPVVAIGGITKDNLSMLAGSGIDGIAVSSAIFLAADPQIAAEELKNKIKEVII
ncbi:MAG: thiamine phosphate synthase [Clostridia bacterium]|nr:thiamine phosphate synthase [Clostridia bacterium]MDD4798705.1 thiamine phosphate synthase [Clostridia bacterium]